MSDAYAIWRAGHDKSNAKTIRIIWPELAAALDGATVTRRPLDVVAEPEPDPTPPLCSYCKSDYAFGRFADDDSPVCINCSATYNRHKRPKVANPAWREWRRNKRAADKAAAEDPAAAWRAYEKQRGRA